MAPLPGTLLYGRTALGENLPVLVDSNGLLAGGGNPFDQDLNTTDDVQFDALTVTSVAATTVTSTGKTTAGSLGSAEVAFAGLPAAPAIGDLANINNSNTTTWGANAAGGGTDHVLVRWNGTNWTVVGK
jgi:hypothetical protein